MSNLIAVSVAAAFFLAVPAMAVETSSPGTPQPDYNSDFKPNKDISPGIYGKMSSPASSKFMLSIGGYVKLDYAYNSVGLGNATPALATVNNRQMPAAGSAAYKQEQSVFTARQSRIWLRASGPGFLGARTGALIETDFYGTGGTNESSLLRMRQAYGTIDWSNTQVLFGQAYDIFGPAIAGMIDFGVGASAGAPNNPRVPQIRLTHTINVNTDNSVKLVLGVQNPSQDTAADTNIAPASAAFQNSYGPAVNVAGQLMFQSKALGVAPGYYGMSMNGLIAGLFGMYGSEKVSGATFNGKHLDSWGGGFYTFVPLLNAADGKGRAMTLSYEGQAYIGANLGLNSATPLNNIVTTNNNPARGFGVYSQFVFFPTQDLAITAGYGRRNILGDKDFPADGSIERSNQMAYANITYDLNAAVRVAVEYENVRTQYAAVPTGATGTVGSANIGRFAAFYFF